MALLKFYRRLLRFYGPQHWWPIYRIKNSVLVRCASPKKLCEKDRFQICVGAILTQNTAWKNVESALANLIAADLTSAEAVIKASEAKLARLIRPAGYFNQKAKKLKIFARWLRREHRSSLFIFFRQPTSLCRAELLSLWGIGPETADSILLYAGGHPIFVIDAYTKHWLHSDYGLQATDYSRWTYDEYQRFFTRRLPPDAKLFNEFHALIVAWAKAQRKHS